MMLGPRSGMGSKERGTRLKVQLRFEPRLLSRLCDLEQATPPLWSPLPHLLEQYLLSGFWRCQGQVSGSMGEVMRIAESVQEGSGL